MEHTEISEVSFFPKEQISCLNFVSCLFLEWVPPFYRTFNQKLLFNLSFSIIIAYFDRILGFFRSLSTTVVHPPFFNLFTSLQFLLNENQNGFYN